MEIEAFCRLRMIELSPWEVEAICRIDDAFLGAAHEKRKEPPKPPAPGAAPTSNPAAVKAVLRGIATRKNVKAASRP